MSSGRTRGGSRFSRLVLATGAAVLGAVPAIAHAQPTPARPSAWRFGSFVVPFEAYDPAKSNLIDGSAISAGTSSYGSPVVSGVVWPLDSFGALLESNGVQFLTSYGYYDTDWAQDGAGPTAGAIFLKSKTLVATAAFEVDLTKYGPASLGGVIGNRVRFLVMAVNGMIADEGSTIGRLHVRQTINGATVDRTLDLVLGQNIRSFKTSTTFCHDVPTCIGQSGNPAIYGAYTLSTAQPPFTKELYSGPCTSAGETCFLDTLSIDIPANEVQYPITSVRVEAFKFVSVISSPPQTVYGGLRLHGITIDADFIAQNQGASVNKVSQLTCPASAERYGGRDVGGVLYGATRNIAELGCALTSGTMAVNYYTGQALLPDAVNTELQSNRGYAPSKLPAAVSGFSAEWQARCGALTSGGKPIALDACDCCTQAGTDCSVCGAPGVPSYGALAEVVDVCCAVKSTPGLPDGTSGTGATIELQRECKNGACSNDLDPIDATSCAGAVDLPATPAVIAGGKPLYALTVTAGSHPFDLPGCKLIQTPGYTTLRRDPATSRPCQPGLTLATIQHVAAGAPALQTGDEVGFFGAVNFDTLAKLHGLSFKRRDARTGASAADEADRRGVARDLEGALARGLVPIIHGKAKKDPHFILLTGMTPRLSVGPDATTGVNVPVSGGFVGTMRVADPGRINAATLFDSFDNTAGRKQFRNVFWGYRLISPATPSARLSIRVYSPAELLVSGPGGAQLGFDPVTGNVVSTYASGAGYGAENQVGSPDADSPAPPEELFKEAWIEQPDGAYSVAVVGTGFGHFSLGVRVDHPAAPPEELWAEGQVSPGAVHVYSIQMSGDGATPAALAELPAVDADLDGFSAPADCDDQDPMVAPFATEDCFNGKDDDCNGLVDAADPQCSGAAPLCPDADLDGWADCLAPGCDPAGLPCGDCDDARADVQPGALEGPMAGATCSDGVDNDCDGKTDVELPACAQIAASPYGIPGFSPGGSSSSGGAMTGSVSAASGAGGAMSVSAAAGSGGSMSSATAGSGGAMSSATAGSGGATSSGVGGSGGAMSSASAGNAASAGASGAGGAVSTATTGGPATTGGSGGAGSGSGSDGGKGGCGCQVPGGETAPSAPVVALAALLGAAARRRRRGDRPVA